MEGRMLARKYWQECMVGRHGRFLKLGLFTRSQLGLEMVVHFSKGDLFWVSENTHLGRIQYLWWPNVYDDVSLNIHILRPD